MHLLSTTIEPLKAYSAGYFLLCLGALAMAAAAAVLLKNRKKSRVLTVTGLLLLILEIAKQLIMPQIYGHYSWSDFPFQLCSSPMYLCLAYPFMKKGRGTVELFLRSFSLMGAIMSFAVPYDILSPYVVLAAHSGLWHTILLFLSFYCMMTTDDRTKVTKKGLKNNALLYLGLALIAVCINALLYKPSQGISNMFFLGPSKPCVAILDNIYLKCGWVVETVVMIAGSELGGVLLLTAEDKILIRRKL